MQRSAILLARVLAFIETRDLTPRGQVFLPELAQALAQKYQFQKSPETIADYDLSKGIEFLQGKVGDQPVLKFVIWDTVLVIETRSGTTESKAALEEILAWATKEFSLNYEPGKIKRFAYISDVTFYSDAPMIGVCPIIQDLADKVTVALSEIWQEPVTYYPVSLKVGHDPMARKNGIAPFSIERRAESRFSENKFFSEAPLPTNMHWKFLEEFEQQLISGRKAAGDALPKTN